MKKTVLMFCMCLMACVLSVISVSNGYAAGFALYEWSSRGNGMGGALTALVDDASAIAYNPAAMTKAEGTQTLVGSTIIAPGADLEVKGTKYHSKNKVYLPPHAYMTHQMNDDLWVGFGTYTRFGLGTNYEHDWAGKYNVYKASLRSHTFSPAVAYKITDKWSVGAAIDAMWLTFDLRKYVNMGTDVDLRMSNSGWAWGGNISTHYEFNKYFSLGAVYRTPQRLVGSGDATFGATDDDLTMRATLPGSATVGFAVKPTDSWRFEGDVVFTNWSDYSQIEFRFDDLAALSSDSTKKWHNAWRFQLGTEYDIDAHNTLRLGFVWDQSPINEEYRDYMLPTNDRQMYSAGYGFKMDSWKIDLSLMYLNMRDTSIDAGDNDVSGVEDTEITNSHAWLGGISVGYEF